MTLSTEKTLDELLHHDGSKVRDWSFESIGGDIRLYFLPLEDGPGAGFRFYAVENTGYSEPFNEPWKNPFVDTIMHGVAYFDGVRHLRMGEDGYLYYPSAVSMVSLFGVLRKLEEKHCMKCELSPPCEEQP